VSIQLKALADEVFEAAAALDLMVPPGMGTVTEPRETRVAMVQVFTPESATRMLKGPGGFSVRPVRDDMGWIAFESLIREAGAEQGRTDAMIAQLITVIRWRAENAPDRFYLAYHGDHPVAHVALFQHRTTAYLHALFTRPDFRRRGAGSFLTQAMDAEARALGCERVALQCIRDSRLPAFFERLGFRGVGEQQP
jgi:GNAT superfamily N-acetyltransferase